MPTRILIVEDDPDIAHLVVRYLEKAGFSTEHVASGRDALQAVTARAPDLLVLDLMLPHVDGLEICRRLRATEATAGIPIIMLTARAEEADKLTGLESGADDYIVKPFSPREWVARVRVVLRRAAGELALPNVLRAGLLALDLDRHTLERGGQLIELTPTEFNLLAALMQNPGQTLTRAQLMDRALGEDFDGYDRTVDAHVKNLRRKIELNPKSPQHILTVFGVGYKFVE
ncbi:MAG: response regulator transcription factor [Chloroflexi bacterium]|nr:response regulator transcription factor [Chloroflexota bacterium]